MPATSLILRADGGFHMGTGHLMRMHALAVAARRAGWRVRLITVCDIPAVLARFTAADVEVARLPAAYPALVDQTETLRQAAEMDDPWLVLDGYAFDSSYQRGLQAAGRRVLVVDDYGHQPRYDSDILLNPNVTASSIAYNLPSGTRRLLGPRFALLRPEWRQQACVRGIREAPPRATRLLVCQGGSDPVMATVRVLEALALIRDRTLSLCVLVGAANPHRAEVEAVAARSPHAVNVLVDPPDLAARLSAVEMAVSAAGTMALELACLRVPGFVTVLADNQAAAAQELERQGLFENLGWAQACTADHMAARIRALADAPDVRTAQCVAQHQRVDGLGCERTLHVLGTHAERLFAGRLATRPARPDDCRVYFDWANDPFSRANSFTTAPIAWEAHVSWFQARLADPGAFLTVLELDGLPAAQVRYQRRPTGRAEISFGVDVSLRGLGLGRWLVAATLRTACGQLGVSGVSARTRPENAPSIRVFQALGFSEQTSEGGGAAERTFILDPVPTAQETFHES